MVFKAAVTALLLKIAYVDWKTKNIKNKNILLLMFLGLVNMWIISEMSFVQRLVGFLAVSVPLLILVLIVPGSIGGGDIKLMAAAGFLLGMYEIWRAFVIGIFIAGVYSMYLLLMGRGNKKTEIALGPFLCIGIIIVFGSLF